MDVFEALADPVRRSLLVTLRGGRRRVIDLTAGRGISRPAVSRHLRHLSSAGLVEADDVGRERHYALRLEALAPVTDLLHQLREPHLTEQHLTEQHLDALETEVRRTVRERRTASAGQQEIA